MKSKIILKSCFHLLISQFTNEHILQISRVVAITLYSMESSIYCSHFFYQISHIFLSSSIP